MTFLQGVIEEVLTAQSEKALTAVLERFEPPHHFERSEERYLFNWFKILNRFDELLERYVSCRTVFSAKKAPSAPTGSSSAAIASNPENVDDTAAAPASSDASPPTVNNSTGSPADATQPKQSSQAAATASDKVARVFTPSPSLVRLILRVTHRLLRNASYDTRIVYNSVEHIGALLADDHSAIVLVSLEILNLLMQRSHKLRSSRTHITFELSDRLLDMAVGWGGRENRLSMLECCSSKSLDSLSTDGSRLYFEYTKTADSAGQGSETRTLRLDRQLENRAKTSNANLNSRLVAGPIPVPISPARASTSKTESLSAVDTSSSRSAIVLENALSYAGDERGLLNFAEKHKVPPGKWFSLLSAFRRAKRFSEGRDARVELTIIRLYAITTLFQVQPMPLSLNDLLGKEPELLQDIVALARASADDGVSDIPRTLRIIAIRCLTAMSSDRHRVESIMSATGVNVHHGALPTLLRTETSSLLSSSPDMGNSSGTERNRPEAMSTSNGPDAQPRSVDRAGKSHGPLSLLSECNRAPAVVQRIHTTEALLSLVHSLAIAAGSSGATPLANSGVLGILIPLLTDRDIRHSRVVAQGIRAMHAIVEGSAQTLGCQMFRDHDGLKLVAARIAAEVGVDGGEVSIEEQNAADEAAEVEALDRRGESRALYERLGRRQMTPLEALEHPPPSSGTTSRGQLPHSKWALLRALHTLLLRSLGNGGSEVRELVVSSDLSKALRKIMAQPFLHGGSLFHSAASVTTEIAHAEPTATAELFKAGLAATVLRTINLGLPPCAEAIRCIPSLLAALCLAPSARDLIVSAKPLQQYLLRLATPFYTRALHGESPVHIGGALDELMRHVEALRPDGNQAMIEYLKLSAKFVETDTKNFKRPVRAGNNASGSPKVESVSASRGDTSMGVDRSAQSSVSSGALKKDEERLSPDAILLDKMKLAVANNSCRLAGFSQGSTEHQEGIVQNEGLEHMIRLRFAPALASTEASVREGYSFSRHYPTPAMTVVSLITSLRNFSSRHAASVLKSLFTVILKDAAMVLTTSKELNDAWLPQEDDLGVNKAEVQLGSSMTEDTTIAHGPLGESEARPGNEDANEGDGYGGRDKTNSSRGTLRKTLSDNLKKLRVGVVLLSGLSRGGPGTSAGVWETARGSQVAAIVSTVERAARYHLAVVYTGLTLSASSDGDLSTARVTAAANPQMKTLRAEASNEIIGNLNKIFGWPVTNNAAFKEACQQYHLPPEGHEPVRQEVKGLAWCLVTFAVAAQRLYSTLAKGLTFSSRRLLRDPARYTASAKSLAATIGRIFALHLMAAERLWDVKVVTMGDNQVLAAWDYVRGILIEIKGTLFDESRRATQSLILRAFLDAGGAEALLKATKPFHVCQAASASEIPVDDSGAIIGMNMKSEEKLDKILQSNALSISCYVLALSDFYSQIEAEKDLKVSRSEGNDPANRNAEKEDTVMSSDSVSHQARAISRIVVSEPSSREADLSALAKEDLIGKDLVAILSSESKMSTLKNQTTRACDLALRHCRNVAVRRVASDAWSTLCGFLHLLGSCPGLLNSGSPPMPLLSGPSNDWGPRDIQRSSLTVTLQLLQTVVTEPENLLASFTPDGTAVGNILGIVHTTSQVADELSQTSTGIDAESNRPEEPEGLRGLNEERRRFSPPRVDPDMLQSLVEMGFSERRAAMALRRTAPGGLEYAAEWLLSHGQDGDGSGDSNENGGRRDSEENQEAEDAGRDGEENDSGDEDVEDVVDDDDDEDGGDDDDENDGDSNDDDDDDDDVDVEESDDVDAEIEEAAGISDAEEETPREDAMTDTGAAGDYAVTSNRPNPSLPQDEVEPQSSNTPRKSGSANRGSGSAGGNSRSGEEEKTAPLVLDLEGPRLLIHSLNSELALLWFALDKSKAVQSDETDPLLASAAFHTGQTLEKEFTGIPDRSQAFLKVACKASPAIAPVSIESFRMAKKQFFHSILNVIRVIVLESENHPYGRHLPYLAVELLSVVRKDGALDDDRTREFSSLLDAGLRAALKEEQKGDQNVGLGLQGQTTAVWSHYGGNHARRALQTCGTLQLAYDCLIESVREWAAASKSPLVDIEATQPIRKLSIREDDLESQLRPELRTITRDEGRQLKRITTCMLLLDAMVRHDSRDRVIECTRSVAKPKEDESPDPVQKPKSKEIEKMDTDKDSEAEADRIDSRGVRDSTKAEDGDPPVSLFNAVLRDLLGTASTAMDIDAKSPEVETVDLDTLRSVATAAKTKMIDATKNSVANWTNASESVLPTSISKQVILQNCLSALALWKGLEVGDAMLAVLQLLGGLTSEWNVARAAIDQGLIDLLLSLPHLHAGKSNSTDHKVVRLLAKTILRHLIEDPNTLQEAMECEFRTLLGGNQRARPTFSMKSLVMSTSPMVARDIQCYISALTSAVRVSHSERRGELLPIPHVVPKTAEIEEVLQNRSNVTNVISALSTVMACNFQESGDTERSPTQSGRIGRRADEYGLAKFALELISELVEVSQVAAVGFIKTTVSSSGFSGSALDFVLQKILALPVADVEDPTDILPHGVREAEELSQNARALFFALCSKTANTHEEAVMALARAVRLEADKTEVCAGVLSGLSQCISPSTKLRVLRIVLESGIANDLARSLRSLQLDVGPNFHVAMYVLRALSLIGQAATHLARHGVETADDISFGSSTRDPWGALRDRDDTLRHSGSYMVL